MTVPSDKQGQWPSDVIPKSWQWINFSNYFIDCTSSERKLPQKQYLKEGHIPVIDQGEILVGGYTNDKLLKYEGQLPVIVWGDHTKCVKFIDYAFVQGADGVKVLFPRSFIEPKYAYYTLQTIKLPEKGYSRHFKFLKSSRFPIAPLNEQQRIVAKLDNLFACTGRAREELARIPKLIERYKQAVLAAACSGQLTADWRKDQNLELIWQSTNLGKLILDKPKNGYSAKPVSYKTSFRVLTLTATTSGKFKAEHFKYFDEIIDDKSPFWLQPNDILIQRGNTIEYVGVSAIYDGPPKHFIFPDLMMRLRVKPEVCTRFLHIVLSCEKSRNYLRNKATGTAGTMPKINQSILVSLPIELPKPEEQDEIVRRVEKLFKAIDLMKQEYQKASKLCDRLEQATLSKAFRGELVPQNPEDEPASALLEHILTRPALPTVS